MYQDDEDGVSIDRLDTKGVAAAASGSRGLTRSGVTYGKTNRAFYDTLKELKAAHWRLFAGKPAFAIVERPLVDRAGGLCEGTLRLPYELSPSKVREELARACAELSALYGNATFEVVLTANALLKGPESNPTWSVFFGYDYCTDGERSIKLGDLHFVSCAGDAEELPTSFDQAAFENVFNKTYTDTTVTIHSLVNLVFIFRRALKNFERERATEGRVHRTLY